MANWRTHDTGQIAITSAEQVMFS